MNQQRNDMTTENIENTERDELAQDLWQAATGKTTNRPEWAFVEAYVDDLAGAILAAGYTKPRQVAAAAELDALGFEAVVLDDCGTPHVCERHRMDGSWNEWRPAGMDTLVDSETILFVGPATVPYSPVVSGE